MPDVPTPARMAVPAMLSDFERRLTAMERQQQRVITDPTGATGDPTHGYAVAVEGQLAPITGLSGYGVAVYSGGSWSRVPTSNLLSPSDTRSVATEPSDYASTFKFTGFKECSALGVPTGTYCSVIGVHAWGDFTGDISHELAFADTGHVYHRSGTGTSWGSWSLIGGT